MSKKSNIYWYCQIVGWSFYIVTNTVFFGLSNHSVYREYLMYFLMLPTGIAISHFYRNLVIRLNILERKISLQLPFIIFSSMIMGAVFFFVLMGFWYVLDLITASPDLAFIFESISNLVLIFVLWNIIYFGFHYFQNYKRTEINALRYLAASKESELKHLKAQLNPHFIFNAMNSIRALIDENPANAKTAVTQLSNILRNTLLMDKSKEIFLKDEINLVKDYLNLEHIRYEERLCYEFKIADDVVNCSIPPFIIQSQVENAIKHGISKQPGKGLILVEAFRDPVSRLVIKVSNTGKINSETPLTGVGFKNSIHRLELLYAAAGKISIKEVNDLVVVEIHIPLK